jgi:parvulin-like peptidyl-prolyl isomerase
MHRWTPLVFGLLFVAAIIGILLPSRRPVAELAVASASASASSAPPTASENPVPVDAGLDTEEASEPARSSAFTKLPDGGAIPPLPEGTPKRVQFGVVLFQYKGAQGASSSTRSKGAALAKAKQALIAAQKDFDEAVKLGDPGSHANAGGIPRGVLEPLIEHHVFRLEPGAVYPEPLDTPRGFWIVRRVK